MIKWGIVGLGNMANKFANSIKEVNNSKLVGIASLDKIRLKSFKENFNIIEKDTYNNYDDLIKSKKIDAIYISTLNNTHLELIRKSAKNKINILCEKPFVINDDEAKKASNYILENNISFYEAISYRAHPQTKVLKDIINQNEIGDIVSITSNFGFKVKKIKPDSRLFNKELGGGSILDIGCYPMSILNFFFDEKSHYRFSDSNGSFTSTNVDNHAEAKIVIDDKIECFIKVSFKEDLDNKVIIRGTKGEITINDPWLPGKKTTIDIKHNKTFYKKFINSNLSIYANQTQKISENFKKKIVNDEFSVNIFNSLHIMKNLTLWSSLIRNK